MTKSDDTKKAIDVAKKGADAERGAPPKEPKTKAAPLMNDMSANDIMKMLHGEVSFAAFRVSGDVLLVHQWGQKSVLEMLAKMAGHDMPQMNKDLTEEGLASAYRNERGEDVLPCRVLKACFVNGASETRGAVKPHLINKYMRVVGHTSPLHFREVDRCLVETVKVGPWNDRVVDLRARTAYYDWYCDIVVRFPHVVIGPNKVRAAMMIAGDSVGLCEKRLEKGFELGGFRVEALDQALVDGIVAANSSPEKRFEIPQELLRAASAQLEDVDKRNPKKKALSVVQGVNSAPDRFAADAAREAAQAETNLDGDESGEVARSKVS
jgi:hypothetical protein